NGVPADSRRGGKSRQRKHPPRGLAAGCPTAPALPAMPLSGAYAMSGGPERVGKDGQKIGQLVAHFATVDDEVDGAMFEQELGALEPFREGFTHGLLDDARTGETDQGARLADVDVAQHGEAGRHAAGG